MRSLAGYWVRRSCSGQRSASIFLQPSKVLLSRTVDARKRGKLVFRPLAEAKISSALAVGAIDIDSLVCHDRLFIHYAQRCLCKNAAEHAPIGFKRSSPGSELRESWKFQKSTNTFTRTRCSAGGSLTWCVPTKCGDAEASPGCFRSSALNPRNVWGTLDGCYWQPTLRPCPIAVNGRGRC